MDELAEESTPFLAIHGREKALFFMRRLVVASARKFPRCCSNFKTFARKQSYQSIQVSSHTKL